MFHYIPVPYMQPNASPSPAAGARSVPGTKRQCRLAVGCKALLGGYPHEQLPTISPYTSFHTPVSFRKSYSRW